MIRKLFKNYILLFLVIIFCMSTGYAYLNSSLYINGTSLPFTICVLHVVSIVPSCFFVFF